jgi:3-oxoadipate enol-lactonase
MTVRLHHRMGGPEQAPVLVLGNGMGTTMSMWQPQLEALEHGFRVVRYDHRGHGGSPVPAGPYTIAELGDDVLRLLDHLGIERVSYCGISLGGMVGIWLAAHAPERIDRLVVCSATARMRNPGAYADRAAQVRAEGMATVLATVASRWFTPRFLAREPEVCERVVGELERTPVEGYAGCCEAIAAMDLRPELGRIRAATLAIAGADDTATPPDDVLSVAAAIDGAAGAVVAEAAHLASIEQPAAVNRLLLDHLAAAPKSDRGELRSPQSQGGGPPLSTEGGT